MRKRPPPPPVPISVIKNLDRDLHVYQDWKGGLLGETLMKRYSLSKSQLLRVIKRHRLWAASRRYEDVWYRLPSGWYKFRHVHDDPQVGPTVLRYSKKHLRDLERDRQQRRSDRVASKRPRPRVTSRSERA